MNDCIVAIETMKDELIKCDVALNGSTLQGVYRELAITMIGDTCKSPRGLTDQGSAIKIRTESTGKDGKGRAMVDELDLSNY